MAVELQRRSRIVEPEIVELSILRYVYGDTSV